MRPNKSKFTLENTGNYFYYAFKVYANCTFLVAFTIVLQIFAGKIQSFQQDFTQFGISHEGERFPHTNFTLGSSWSIKFATLINRRFLGLKVTSV